MGKKDEAVFRFKHFSCRHGASSMKIGVDAVLLGAWAYVSDALRILDVGTGCGVIALMCAQRNESAIITGIDIDADSINEAKKNFSSSPWSARIEAKLEDFCCNSQEDIDLIISNPPYFNSGVLNPDSPRLKARHIAGLSPESILKLGSEKLSKIGRIAMIVPAEQRNELNDMARKFSLKLLRIAYIRGHEKAPVKRTLLEFVRDFSDGIQYNSEPQEETIILEITPGIPHDSHIKLCKDFYLKF